MDRLTTIKGLQVLLDRKADVQQAVRVDGRIVTKSFILKSAVEGLEEHHATLEALKIYVENYHEHRQLVADLHKLVNEFESREEYTLGVSKMYLGLKVELKNLIENL